MDDKVKLERLLTLQAYIQSIEFQEFVMQPLFKELEKIQKLKGYKSWDSVLKAQGKEEGLLKLIDIFKQNETDIKNIRFDLKSDAE